MKNLLLLFITLLGVIMGHAQAKRDSITMLKVGAVQYGTASYYGGKFNGRKTSTGELFDEKKMTCAHNTLPLNTWIRVTNLRNNKSVVVRVNDRLHPKNKRLVDLSKAAATKLGYIGRGLTRVKVEVLGKKPPAT